MTQSISIGQRYRKHSGWTFEIMQLNADEEGYIYATAISDPVADGTRFYEKWYIEDIRNNLKHGAIKLTA